MLIIFVIIVLLIAGVMVPGLMVQDNSYRKQVIKMIDEFHAKEFSSVEQKDVQKFKLKVDIANIKAKVVTKAIKEEIGDWVNAI